jgi:hypothetical protein
MRTSHSIELPELTHRDLTSSQYLDGCRRITTGLLTGATPIPASDSVLRDLATDCASAAEELACRLVLDRKSDFTRDKKQANAKRIKFFHGGRREVKNLLRSLDPKITDGQKATAKEVLVVLDKHAIPAGRRSQAEVSTSVQGFLADIASKEMQRAIAEIDLTRIFDLLKKAQDEYAAITRKEDEATAISPAPEATDKEARDTEGADPAAPLDPPSKPRLVREIKEGLSADLTLLFKMMAYQVRKGRKPYAALLTTCREITAELNQVAKNRETRERKAEAKREKKEQAGGTAGAKQGSAPATAEPPAATRSGTAPVVAQNGADSALAG